MKRNFSFVLWMVCIVAWYSCTMGRKIQFENVQISDVPSVKYPFAVAFMEHRPEVVSGRESALYAASTLLKKWRL